jgi:hypothetical protein
MHDNEDAIKAMEYIIEEMKADRLRIISMRLSSPVKEKNVEPFQDFKKFEHTGDVYINMHFANKGETT